MKKYIFFFFSFFCVLNFVFAQKKFVINNAKQSDKISFELVNNLVVIPVEVNGIELSFILDTGVSKPIIFNFFNDADTLRVKNTETIYIRGLGDGKPLEALKSKNNTFKIGDAVKLEQDFYAVQGLGMDFGPRLGIPIHGIIGLDLFKDFVVEINYSSNNIVLTDPQKYRYKSCKNCERFSLEFYNDKPYVNAVVSFNKKEIPVKLLIDSGGSDSLWLFEDDSLGINSGDKFFNDFLGHGLSGSVYGKRGKVEAFHLKSFELKNANVAYPDSTSIVYAKKVKTRNGSLSGNILKRFNIVLDYRNALITLRKNSKFKEAFNYNKSGIELAHTGLRYVKEFQSPKKYKVNGFESRGWNSEGVNIVMGGQYKVKLKPSYAIVELRAGSAAEKAGLQEGDIILSINGKLANHLKLQQITAMFYDRPGKLIKLKIERDSKVLKYDFKLESLLE